MKESNGGEKVQYMGAW